METLNDAEEFVYKVCKQSFLSMWSYANPQGKDGKELCDILVVCEPDIIIFSVKDIKLIEDGDEKVNHERWRKRAVEASAKQIYGAERYLQSAHQVTRKDGTPGLSLSKDVAWRTHRVAVALGGQRKVAYSFGNLGKGYVHVFDEKSFFTIVQELDTITDFVNYLVAKEELRQRGVTILFEGAEEDLLAFYIQQERKFPEGLDVLMISEDLWDSLTRRPEFDRRREADRESYVWDRVIEEMSLATSNDGTGAQASLSNVELAVRVMARESRFSRRVLGKTYIDFLRAAKAEHVRARMVQSQAANVAYTFLHVSHGEGQALREAELGHRCLITRGTIPNCTTVVGISTEDWKEGVGCYSYLCYLHKSTWTDADKAHMEDTKKQLGFFETPRMGRIREDEFPGSGSRSMLGRLPTASRAEPFISFPKIGRNQSCPCGSGKKYKHCHGMLT